MFKERVVTIFVKALSSSNAELQKTAFECMKRYLVENTVDMDMVSFLSNCHAW
jgi:hypothetical protein